MMDATLDTAPATTIRRVLPPSWLIHRVILLLPVSRLPHLFIGV